jgi:hypothetical protein
VAHQEIPRKPAEVRVFCYRDAEQVLFWHQVIGPEDADTLENKPISV